MVNVRCLSAAVRSAQRTAASPAAEAKAAPMARRLGLLIAGSTSDPERPALTNRAAGAVALLRRLHGWLRTVL